MIVHDTLTKLGEALLVKILLRVIDMIWKNYGADDVVHALLEQAKNSGTWHAVWSATKTIVAMCQPPNKSWQVIISSFALAYTAGIFISVPLNIAFDLPNKGIIGGVVSGAQWALLATIANFFAGSAVAPLLLMLYFLKQHFIWVMVGIVLFVPSLAAIGIVVGSILHPISIATVMEIAVGPTTWAFNIASFATLIGLLELRDRLLRRLALFNVGADAGCAVVQAGVNFYVRIASKTL